MHGPLHTIYSYNIARNTTFSILYVLCHYELRGNKPAYYYKYHAWFPIARGGTLQLWSNLQKQIKYTGLCSVPKTPWYAYIALHCKNSDPVNWFNNALSWSSASNALDWPGRSLRILMLWVPGREALNSKSISCSAQFVNLENISHPRLLFFNSTHKTKTRTANRWETTNSNPPRPIKLSSQHQ
jgi:hypothetical protein